MNRLLLSFPLLSVCAACSSSVEGNRPPADAAVAEASAAPDGGKKLWSCADPGLACNAHDTCALDPVCGVDGVCRPSGYQNCSDGLDCTEDTCKELGLCEHRPVAGWCGLTLKGSTRCFKAGDISPDQGCMACIPTVSTSTWSPRNGGGCDDGDLCTTDDYCQEGKCIGKRQSCDDQLDCTTDSCDGHGGCTHQVAAGSCMIEGKCYQDGAEAPQSCGRCEAAKSGLQWTVPSGKCLIDSACVPAGLQDKVGCASCDPVASTSRWTPLGGTAATTIDLESGGSALKFTPATNGVGWQVASLRAHGGTRSLYYGNPIEKKYDSGGQNQGRVSLPAWVLPAQQRATLHFWVYLDVQTSSYQDVLTVEVSTTDAPKAVWTKDYQAAPYQNYKRWMLVEVDLSQFAGTTATVSFAFDTKTSYSSPTGEGVFIDDIALITKCGPLSKASPFVMDGQLDSGATNLASGTGRMPLYVRVDGEYLYVATDDAGEGNDNFIMVGTGAASSVPAPWGKAGTVALDNSGIFAADENDNGFCALATFGGKQLQACGPADPKGPYGVATPAQNEGYLEAFINLRIAFGYLPTLVYVSAAAYGNGNSGQLVSSVQTPPSKDGNENIESGELLKVSIPVPVVGP